MVMEQGDLNPAGLIKVPVLSTGGVPERYGGLCKTFASMRWSWVAAFQTRKPMHRSHEDLAKTAIEICDGILIHSLPGNLKAGDIPVDNGFVRNTIVQAG